MYKYVIKRLLLAIPVLIGATFLVFAIMDFAPGDTARIILGSGATEQALALICRADYIMTESAQNYCDIMLKLFEQTD